MAECSEAGSRQQIHFDGDEPDQQQADPVSLHCSRGEDDAAHDAVKPAVLINSGQKTNRQTQPNDIYQ